MHQIFRNAMWRVFRCLQNWHSDVMLLFGMIFRQFWKLSCHQAVLNDLWVMLDWYISPLNTVIGYSFYDMNSFKAVLSTVFTKDTSILINHRLMLINIFLLWHEVLMNAVCLIWILFIQRWQLSFHQTVAMISWTWLTSGACLIDTARLWLMPWRMTYPHAVGLFGSCFSSLLSPLHSQFYKTTGFSHEFFIM